MEASLKNELGKLNRQSVAGRDSSLARVICRAYAADVVALWVAMARMDLEDPVRPEDASLSGDPLRRQHEPRVAG